ncbi:MAG: class I SAM-dependent methyltransferase [Deltaproteobacteria bacterium]|nr:MAG: class I SAM-dependent methyltransferase [Deltaproteobacteria bacterium]
MKDFWNERYSQEEYAYGLEPNEYLKAKLADLTPGTLFLPGDGEGRNSVYAAQQGWTVDALDYSKAAQEKTLRLAQQHNVRVNHTVSDIADATFPPDTYDAVGLIYFHLPPELRAVAYPKMVSVLKPGGWLIVEVFSKEQLGRSSGGPKNEAMLFSLEIIQELFPDLTVHELTKTEVTLREGRYHEGDASVIRFLGQKQG